MPDRIDARLCLLLLERVAAGTPVGPDELVALARTVDPDRPERRAERATMLAEVVDGRVVGVHGLTLRPAAYRLRLPGGVRGAWCALDTLFLPPLLAQPAQIDGRCAATGAPLAFALSADGWLERAEPPDIAVTVPLPDADTPPRTHDELREIFCAHSRFAVGLATAGELAAHPAARILTLADAAAVGRGIAAGLRARAGRRGSRPRDGSLGSPPMALADRIQADLTAAMKARDTETVATLRMVVAAIKNLRVAAGHSGDVTDEEVTDLLAKQAKQRTESAEAYEQAGRDDLAAKERRELEIIRGYLPEQLDEDELARIVDDAIAETGASGPGDLGRVMGAVMPKVKGRADGKQVNALVRQRLGAG